MDVFIYVIVMLASFLGLLIGIIISNIASEEINQTSKYLKYINMVLVPIIFCIAIYNINKIISVIMTAALLAALIIVRNKYNDGWIYSSMGGLLFVSTLSNTIADVSILIFIYGVSVATINADEFFKKKINGHITLSENLNMMKKFMSKYSYFLLVAIMFFTVFTYIL